MTNIKQYYGMLRDDNHTVGTLLKQLNDLSSMGFDDKVIEVASEYTLALTKPTINEESIDFEGHA